MKDILSFLTDEQGRCFTVQNGQVRTTAQLKALTYNPGGLGDIVIGWERSLPELGITRNFSAPLQFHLEGATILKDYTYGQSLESKMYLLLHQRVLRYDASTTPATYSWHYRSYYKGEIDPTTIKHADVTVTANIAEGGIYGKYKANKATMQEIPVDDADSLIVKMDGINLEQSASFFLPSELPLSNINYPGRFTPPLALAGTEGTSSGVGFLSENIENIPDLNTYVHDSDNWLLQVANDNGGPVAFNITGKVRWRVTKNDIHGSFGMAFRTSLNRVPTGITIPTPVPVPGSSFGETYYPTGDYETLINIQGFSLAPGEKLFFFCSYSTAFGATEMSIEFLPESDIKVAYKNAFAPSYVRVQRADAVFRKLGGKVLGDETLVHSDLLSTNAWPCITCGDAVRGIAGSVIKTSLDQFFSFARVVAAAGIGIEGGKLLIEPYAHFLDEGAPIAIGGAKNLVVTTATDQLVNTVRIGYEPKDIDDLNGRYAFNMTQTYSSPLTRVQKELTLVCPYVADPYIIEIQRINFENKTTTDSDKDNMIMLLDVDFDNPQTAPGIGTYYNLRRPAGTTITGVPDPATIFNVGLSPKRLLQRHAQLLASLFWGIPNMKLTFTTTERNRDLKTVTGSAVVEEKADFPITAAPLFIPKVFDLDTEAPTELVDLMEANPNRCFQFQWYGYTYTGFSLKVGIAPVDHKGQAYKLLCAPSSNLQNLIFHG